MYVSVFVVCTHIFYIYYLYTYLCIGNMLIMSTMLWDPRQLLRLPVMFPFNAHLQRWFASAPLPCCWFDHILWQAVVVMDLAVHCFPQDANGTDLIPVIRPALFPVYYQCEWYGIILDGMINKYLLMIII